MSSNRKDIKGFTRRDFVAGAAVAGAAVAGTSLTISEFPHALKEHLKTADCGLPTAFAHRQW